MLQDNLCASTCKITIKLDDIVCYPILVPHLEHVVLDGADDDEDKETAEAEFTHTSLGVPRHLGWSQYARVDSFVEEVVLGEDEQDDQGHVDVVVAAAGSAIKGLKNWDDQSVDVSGGQHIVVETLVLVQQKIEQERCLIGVESRCQRRIQHWNLHLKERRSWWVVALG